MVVRCTSCETSEILIGEKFWRQPHHDDFIRGDGGAVEAIRKGISEFDSLAAMGAKA
jgi:hypothetical protein